MQNILARNKRLKLLLTPLILFGIIAIAMVLSVIFKYRTIEEISQMPFERVFFGIGETLVLVFFYNYVIRKLNVKYPWAQNWLIRSLIDFIVALFFPVLMITAFNLAFNFGWLQNHGPDDKYKIMMYIMPLMISALLMVVVEMIVATEERNKLEIKLANLEKEQIKSKYAALKEQLDHHFLFNNLSVLSSLIYESTEKADRFIQDFASIYRYVLSINKQDLVSVNEELEFIETYLNLYKFRFEDGFSFKVNICENCYYYLIPPLTLQVIVENVFKHNVVSKKHPLTLEIIYSNQTLLISNTLQAKNSTEDSTQTGQQNLIEKFKLLNCDSPTFEERGGNYIVQIPLIKPSDD
ncbi:sensor histidine kinase [Carboxylicivirga marina]|uniref:sensor histidine kinase n=1 Tax=Carboxylicivirga marina TaxID=2800988 RepID=UPI0025951B4D|nr:sensor histidine kinase [uncultured Carboxylicivirga sp.]